MNRLMTLLMTVSAFVMTSPLMAQEDIMPPRDQGMWQTMVLIAIALVFFYFILWRPEQKRRKDMEKQRDTMKKGDRVTAMGIIGTISKVGEHTVILRMVDGTKIEFLKAAITDVMPEVGEESKETENE